MTRAQDKAEAAEAALAVEAELADMSEEKRQLEREVALMLQDLDEADRELLEIMDEQQRLKEELAQTQDALGVKDQLIQAFSQTLSETLDRQITLSPEDIPDEWLTKGDHENLIEEWLKYKQIGDRYLFVDVTVNADSGLIAINGDSTGIVITLEIARDPVQKSEAVLALEQELRNWLSLEKGGTQFVFLSVEQEGLIYRQVEEAVLDAMKGVQALYDKEFYMINRF